MAVWQIWLVMWGGMGSLLGLLMYAFTHTEKESPCPKCQRYTPSESKEEPLSFKDAMIGAYILAGIAVGICVLLFTYASGGEMPWYAVLIVSLCGVAAFAVLCWAIWWWFDDLWTLVGCNQRLKEQEQLERELRLREIETKLDKLTSSWVDRFKERNERD